MKPANPQPLIEVAEWLEAGAPEKSGVQGFYMDYFKTEVDKSNLDHLPGTEALFRVPGIYHPPCGTVCCIAGAMVVFSEEDPLPFFWVHRASRLAGMEADDADELFCPSGFVRLYCTPADAAKTIRHYVETGEVDWSHVENRKKE